MQTTETGQVRPAGARRTEVRWLDPKIAEAVASIVAAALVRGYPYARELSDELYAAGYRLPLMNWPTSAFETLAHYSERTAGLRAAIERAA